MPLEAHHIKEPCSEERDVLVSRQPSGDPRQPPTKRGWSIHFGLYVLALAVSMPRLLQSFSPSRDVLDTSWTWMLGYAVQHHLQWGKSLVFTYGPLGFLTDTYFYSDHVLWGLSATSRLTSWIAFGLGFACIARRLGSDDKPFPKATLPVAIGWIIGACFLDLSSQCAVLGVLLLVLALTEESSAAVGVELTASGSLLALGALIKSTGLIVSLFALLIYPALCWYAGRRRRALYASLVPLLSFSISFCALWLLASQSFANLPAYFRGTWEIVSGYTPAMSTPDLPVPVLRVQIWSALLILSLLAGVLIALYLRGTKVRVAQSLLLAGVAFWAWKEGFTLQDPGYVRHPMTFYGTALLIASVGTVLPSTEDSRYLRACVYGAYAVALLFAILGYPPESLSYAHMPENYENYLGLIFSGSRRAAEQRFQTLSIQKQFQLSAGVLNAVGHASVNVIPWSLMMAQGDGMRLVASPVIQSYSVYTPYLDQLNARQIWDGTSADKIIYGLDAFGYRYPPFDEPATFRAMLSCYRTEYPGDPYAVLSRIRCAPPESTTAGVQEEGSYRKWILVPPAASYVDLDVHTNVIGSVKDILRKADHVWILFGLPNGEVAGPFQLIYPVAEDGLFVRYFIGSQSDFAHLFSGNASGLQRIAAIQLVTDPGSVDYAKHFGFRFVHANPSPDERRH